MSKYTPEQIEEMTRRWDRGIEQEQAARHANLARDKRFWAAMQEQNFSGQLRRALFDSGIDPAEIARRADVPLTELADFQAGDAPLDSDAVGRLLRVLNYELTPAS